jgi:hypothetical protein
MKMNGYALTAAIFQSIASLAWPAAIFGSVWLFRRQLIEMLPNFRAKYKDVEIDFRLKQGEQEAAALPPAETGPESVPTPEETSKFDQLVEISPRAAILEMKREVEAALYGLVRLTNIPGGQTRSMLQLTRLLRNEKIIDASTSALLDDLRSVGNSAAHENDVNFTKDDAQRFRALATTTIRHLQAAEVSASGM